MTSMKKKFYAKQMVQYCEHWVMSSSPFLFTQQLQLCYVWYSVLWPIKCANFLLFQIFRYRRQNAVVLSAHVHLHTYKSLAVHVVCANDTFSTMEMNGSSEDVRARPLSLTPTTLLISIHFANVFD